MGEFYTSMQGIFDARAGIDPIIQSREIERENYIHPPESVRIRDRVVLEIGEHFEFYKHILAPGSLVLDIGTGTGLAARHIKDHASVVVVGLDVEQHTEYPQDITRILYDGVHAPIPDKSVDTSLLFYTLHHAHNPGAVLDEAVRMTKKNLIVIEESDAPGADHGKEMAKEAVVYDSLGLAPEFHHNGMSNQEFEALLAERSERLVVQSKQKLFSRTQKRVEKFLYILNVV